MKLLGKNSDERSIRSWVLWGDALLGLQDLQAVEIPLRMAKWRQDVSARLISDDVPVSKARLMTEINRVLPADGYLVADGGFAAHWGGLLFDTSGPAATLCRVAVLRRSDMDCPGDGRCNGGAWQDGVEPDQ
jgi:hypothetical protein